MNPENQVQTFGVVSSKDASSILRTIQPGLVFLVSHVVPHHWYIVFKSIRKSSNTQIIHSVEVVCWEDDGQWVFSLQRDLWIGRYKKKYSDLNALLFLGILPLMNSLSLKWMTVEETNKWVQTFYHLRPSRFHSYQGVCWLTVDALASPSLYDMSPEKQYKYPLDPMYQPMLSLSLWTTPPPSSFLSSVSTVQQLHTVHVGITSKQAVEDSLYRLWKREGETTNVCMGFVDPATYQQSTIDSFCLSLLYLLHGSMFVTTLRVLHFMGHTFVQVIDQIQRKTPQTQTRSVIQTVQQFNQKDTSFVLSFHPFVPPSETCYPTLSDLDAFLLRHWPTMHFYDQIYPRSPPLSFLTKDGSLSSLPLQLQHVQDICSTIPEAQIVSRLFHFPELDGRCVFQLCPPKKESITTPTSVLLYYMYVVAPFLTSSELLCWVPFQKEGNDMKSIFSLKRKKKSIPSRAVYRRLLAIDAQGRVTLFKNDQWLFVARNKDKDKPTHLFWLWYAHLLDSIQKESTTIPIRSRSRIHYTEAPDMLKSDSDSDSDSDNDNNKGSPQTTSIKSFSRRTKRKQMNFYDGQDMVELSFLLNNSFEKQSFRIRDGWEVDIDPTKKYNKTMEWPQLEAMLQAIGTRPISGDVLFLFSKEERKRTNK